MMKKAKNLIIYVINRIYTCNDKNFKDDVYVECARVWHLSYRKNEDYELETEEICNFMTELYTVEQFVKKYDKEICQHPNTYLLFGSFYDIDPKLNRAFHYLKNLLMTLKFKIFILSLNPYSDFTSYFYRPRGEKALKRIIEDTDTCEYLGPFIEDIHVIPTYKRNKHTKYPDILFKFAVSLRQGYDTVTYDTIRATVGIPKPTLYSYAKRNKIELSKDTGRNYLSDKEMEELEKIKALINHKYSDII